MIDFLQTLLFLFILFSCLHLNLLIKRVGLLCKGRIYTPHPLSLSLPLFTVIYLSVFLLWFLPFTFSVFIWLSFSCSHHRGLFLIDPEGVVRHMSINDLPVGRSVDETLRLVKAFQFVAEHGEVCPAGWTPDSETVSTNLHRCKALFVNIFDLTW